MEQFRRTYFFLKKQGVNVNGLGKVSGNGGIMNFTWDTPSNKRIEIRTTQQGMCKVGFYQTVSFEGTYQQAEDYILKKCGLSRQLSLFA